jgi:preprotein translocase subunit SecB
MNEAWARMLRPGGAPATRRRDPARPRADMPITLILKDDIMADDAGVPDFIDTEAGNGNDGLPQVGILAQYVKDLSFENPNAPAVYQWQDDKKLSFQINTSVQPVSQDVYEVLVKFEIEARGDQGKAFSIDLHYAGLFALQNIPEEQLQPFLLAEAPRILFPFARRIISEATIDAGFPPLLLDPIDFAGLYMQRAAHQQAEASGGQAGEVTGQA